MQMAARSSTFDLLERCLSLSVKLAGKLFIIKGKVLIS